MGHTHTRTGTRTGTGLFLFRYRAHLFFLCLGRRKLRDSNFQPLYALHSITLSSSSSSLHSVTIIIHFALIRKQ